jgi:hypothetical protein
MSRWSILGDIGDEFAEKAFSMLKKWGPYRVQKKDGKISFAISFSKRGSGLLLQRSKWMDRNDLRNFSLDEYEASPAISDLDRFAIEPDSFPKIQDEISNRPEIKKLELYQRIIFNSSITQQEYALKEIVAPGIESLHADPKVLFLTPSPRLHFALAALRVLGSAIDLADRNVQDFENLPPLRMLQATQNSGVLFTGKHLTIPLSIFLPKLYGFVASKVVYSYIFSFNNPIDDVRENFPRSGLEFIRSEANTLFHQDINLDVLEITPEKVDKFCLLPRRFSGEDIRKFISQYINKLDSFLHFIIDPSNFSNIESNKWGGLSHYQAWLCFERIADEMILMVTDDNSYLRKTALFRVLDQLSALGSDNHSNQVDQFKDFILPKNGDDIIISGLNEYKGNIAKYLRERLVSIREETLTIGIDSIFLKDRINRNEKLVKLSGGTQITYRDYVVNLIRELRNTYHGYYTNRFDKYLAISTGDTPDSLPGIGLMAYLSFISRPDLFIGRKLS